MFDQLLSRFGVDGATFELFLAGALIFGVSWLVMSAWFATRKNRAFDRRQSEFRRLQNM